MILFIVACRPIDFLLNSDKIYLEFINIRVGNVMVTFRLIDENIRYIIYWYFPEGNEEKGNGIITIDKENDCIDISKLAPDDFTRIITIEEQNAMRDSINQMRIEEGMEELSEEEFPSATKPLTETFYADHAIRKIVESYNNGIVLKDGMALWY